MKKYFNSFEGLRIFAFLNIFLLHVGSYRITNFPTNAAWAVSFFFMISGFLNGNKLFKENLKLNNTIDFTLKKIVKIYPLYLITLLLMLPFSGIITTNHFNNDLYIFIKKLIYNLTMTQSFANDLKISYAFTGVAWFLSDFMFLMLITIPIILLLRKLISKKKHAYILLIITILFGFIYTDFLTYLKVERTVWLYVFPISRVFEYISGIILGIIFNLNYKNRKITTKTKIIYTFIEIIVLGLLILSLKVMPNLYPYEMTVGWIIPNLIILLLFSYEKGFISKFLGNKLFVHLGKLTFDTYLIHEVVNMYFYIVPGLSIITSNFSKLKASLFILIITFLLAEFNQKDNIFTKLTNKILNAK